jgi:glycosidase
VAAPAGKLHVPSPDWRDQVIYFAVTDRFADGNPRNNNQGVGEYTPGQRSRYQGGDLQGLTQRLDYIRGLGATALWITPPVANQWINPSGDYTGYHGYWAENMLKVDKHLGTLADYQALSRGLHRRGMYLVQDIVVNHMGNFYTYRNRWQPGQPAHGWEAHDQTAPVPRPSQPPFNLNDPRDARQRAAGIYHWTPDISDYNNPLQEHTFQMSGLDDLNTENPAVRRALRRSFGHWIKAAGVDAFRVDTAFYVPPAFFADFLHAKDPAAPGVLRVARATGRKAFHVFGEGFGIDKPGQDTQARKIESYVRGPQGQPLMPGMLNFPLYGSLGDVFARGQPPAVLADRIQRTMAVHSQPHLMVNFLDNHDVDRFLAGSSEAGLRQALLAMFTLPGIPAITYGTEQGFTEQRAALFAAGWGSGGRDRYDTQAPLYRAIAQMAALRKQHRVLSRGMPTVLHAAQSQQGALAWKMAAISSPPAQRHTGPKKKPPGSPALLVVFNTASHSSLLDGLETGLPAGTRLKGAYGLAGTPADLQVGAGGRITLALAPHSGQVWQALPPPQTGARAPGAEPVHRLELSPLPDGPIQGDFKVSGRAPAGTAALRLVVDGDLQRAQALQPGADGHWQATVDTSGHTDPAVLHHLVAYDEATGATSARHSFKVQRTWQLQADVADPAGDDIGPDPATGVGPDASASEGTSEGANERARGPYSYPTDPSWGPRRQMDVRRVRVYTSGSALRVAVQTHEISTLWNPANGFDHVAFTLFIELPGRTDGVRVMPLQDGEVPAGFAWHLRLRAHGWSNALFDARGASASQEGTAVMPGAQISVDKAGNEVVFTLPAAALGRLPSLAGTRLWLNTWDYDGGYRALGPIAQPFAMGGAAAGSPKVMDASAVIKLP